MKKFFKKPLNVLSLVLAVLGLIGIVVMLVVPHGAAYTRTVTDDNGKKSTYTYTIKSNKLYATSVVDGKTVIDNQELGTIEVSKGSLYYKVSALGVETKTEVGKINAFEIKANLTDETYKCTLTMVFFVIACVMTALGVVGLVYGAVAKPKKKRK